jgi:pantothenate kinase-related protein Tda10
MGQAYDQYLVLAKKTGMTPQLDEDGNPIIVGEGSKSGSSKTATLEDLMKRLKVKGKKATTYSSSSKDGDSSCEEEV